MLFGGVRGVKKSNLSGLLQSHVFMTLVAVSPQVISFHLLWLVTAIYLLRRREDRAIIRNNIEEVFGRNRNKQEIDTLFRSTLKGIFCHYFEKLFLACATNRQWKDYLLERIRIYRRRLLDQSLAKHRGLILVTSHFGAVEFLPGFLTLLGYPVAIVARFKTQRLREKCKEKARDVGATIIDADGKSSFFLALSALKQGRILITQCDEVECWKAHPRRTIPLFETSFQADRTVTILQKRSGAPVLFGYIRREGKGRYTAEIEDLSGSDGPSSQGLAEEILKKFEKLIYTHPDQWYIWKNFQRMKATGREEIPVENRKGRDLPITPTPVAVFQPSRGFPELYGQHRCQVSI